MFTYILHVQMLLHRGLGHAGFEQISDAGDEEGDTHRCAGYSRTAIGLGSTPSSSGTLHVLRKNETRW